MRSQIFCILLSNGVALPWESVAKQISFINMQIYVGNEDFQSAGMNFDRDVMRKNVSSVKRRVIRFLDILNWFELRYLGVIVL